MSAWKDRGQEQVGAPLCGERNRTGCRILLEPEQTSGSRLTFGNGSKKHFKEDSMLETSAKHNNLNCNVENRSILNTSKNFKDLRLDLDTWPDQDSVIPGETSNLNDAAFLNPLGNIMTNYHSSELLHKNFLSSFSISHAPLCSNLNKLDGEPELFGHDEGNERFLNYDWVNIEDFDNMFRNNESFCGNEMVHSTDGFLKTSGDVISNTFPSVPVPDFPTSMVQFSDSGSSSHYLLEHSDEKVNTLDTEKEDAQNQTPILVKEEKGKDVPFQNLDYSWSSGKQSISCCEVDCSTMSSHIHLQSQPGGVQGGSSCDVIYADYESHPFQFPGFPFQPQSHEISDKAGDPGQKSIKRTSRENIEKLSWRKLVQDQYSQLFTIDDITSHDQNTIKEYNWKFASSEVSNMLEQDQSKMLSSSINERFTEEAIYHQLQESVGKLEMKARVAISNSLFRLARNATERQGACGKTWNGKNEEDETSVRLDLQWQSRISSIPNSEVATNPMDRIVAHLLFHNSSGSYQLPFGDLNAPTVMSM